MKNRQPLTEIAHQDWLSYLGSGGWAIDATAGNGHDTEFLARTVAPDGRVFAMDIQDCAIEATRLRLAQANLTDRVNLVRADHSVIRDVFGCGIRGKVDLICFNLGYLPTGDHAITTTKETTLTALYESLLLLNPDGALSVIAYRGHPGAQEEADCVERFFSRMPSPWKCVRCVRTGTDDNPGPVWWLATCRQD